MKLRQNKLVPLRLREHVAQDERVQERFEEILEVLDSTRLDWASQTSRSALHARSAHPAHSTQTAHSAQPTHSAQPSQATRSSSDRQSSELSLGATLAHLPQQTLGEYTQAREPSLLSHVFRIAANYQSHTDRVIFLGDSHSQSVIKAILHACCDPYWNSWTRAERGSKPRRFFAGESWDNDTHQAIVEHFSDRRATNRHEEFDWGVVRLTSPKNSRQELREECLGTDPVDSFATVLKKLHAARHIPTARLATNTDEELWIDCLATGPSVGYSNAVATESTPVIPSSLIAFTFSGLLSAAILGVNVMELLAGAHFISKQFFELDKSSNPVLRWTAWQILAQQSGIARQLYFTNSTLESSARWLLELNENRNWPNASNDESTPPYTWALCPPHRYHNSDVSQQHRNLWQCHLVVNSVRYDDLQVPDGCESNYRDVLQRQIQQKTHKLGTSTASGLIIEFPIVDELAIGQWMQWMILADLLQAETQTTAGK